MEKCSAQSQSLRFLLQASNLHKQNEREREKNNEVRSCLCLYGTQYKAKSEPQKQENIWSKPTRNGVWSGRPVWVKSGSKASTQTKEVRKKWCPCSRKECHRNHARMRDAGAVESFTKILFWEFGELEGRIFTRTIYTQACWAAIMFDRRPANAT